MSDPSHILWLYAHPMPTSLNAAVRDEVISRLPDRSWRTEVVDLYAEGWNPLLSHEDVAAASGRTLSDRQRAATLSGSPPDAVRTQQERVMRAQLIVVQFPLWWYGMPAILKGWFDRVFTNGFAFGVRDENGRVRKYGDGNLAGRRLLPVVTAGDRETALRDRGISGDIDDILWPLLHGTAHYTGMTPLRTHLIAEADSISENRVETEVGRLHDRITGASRERPLGFRSLRGGDYGQDHTLHDHVAPTTTGHRAHTRF